MGLPKKSLVPQSLEYGSGGGRGGHGGAGGGGDGGGDGGSGGNNLVGLHMGNDDGDAAEDTSTKTIFVTGEMVISHVISRLGNWRT